MKKLFFASGLAFFLFASCKHNNQSEYGPPVFPLTPVDMGDINSAYDDYNSTAPFSGSTFPFCFSSNVRGLGKNFDINYRLLDVYFSFTDGHLTVAENSYDGTKDIVIENENLKDAVSKLNTLNADEMGPYLISQGQRTNGSMNRNGRYESYLFLYANNESGNLDIKFVENLSHETYTEPRAINFLNSGFDDAYPSLMQVPFSVYFCSNREGDFNIYKTDLDINKDLLGNFADTNSKIIIKDSILSSVYDDKCPYVCEKMVVFTSNRAGGFGGFDLYYSRMENGKWLPPVNFGQPINSEFDEYRPIVIPMIGFENDMMIFSSNRPGGKGGFDLYYVGVDKVIKQ